MTESEYTSGDAGERAPESYRLALRRPVTVAMLFLTLLVFGWKSYQELPINLMPDISYPTLSVRTEYEGAAPEDVEKLVTRPLEERLSIVNGVVELSSISSAGLSEIIMEFTWGTNMDVAMQDVRESLDIFDPPEGVTQEPVILRYDPTLDPVMRIGIRGRDVGAYKGSATREEQQLADLTEIREAAEKQIKPDLEAEAGIAEVRVKGGHEEEIQIMLDSARLKNLGLVPEDVVMALQQQNVNLSGGRLKEGRTEYLVRTLNEFQDIEEIRGVIIVTPQGEPLRLDDVARIEFGTKERDTIVRVNGQEVVELEFYKEGTANVVQVSNKLKEFFGFRHRVSFQERMLRWQAKFASSSRMDELLERIDRRKKMSDKLRTRLPDYIAENPEKYLVLITDQARFIEASIREVLQTALAGGLLALLVLFLFLREVKTTLIIGIAIPISVVATFVPMFMGQISLNIMSLGGLALGIGMLVDNSIVVLESIFRCREEGDGIRDAAERGTREVASAVTASTLTTIAVFLPIVFVEGIAGQLFRDLALTVTFSLIASLGVALYLIPMIASREPLHFGRAESGVWLVRAFAAGRRDGRGRMASVFAIPRFGVGYVRTRFTQSWMETVAHTAGEAGESAGLAKALLYALVPIVFALFVLQGILNIVATLFITVLFGVTLVLLGVLWILSKIFRFVLYLPLNLFGHGFNAMRGAYSIMLRRTLQFSPIILIAVALLSIHAAGVSLSLGRELIPPLKQGEFGIRLEAPPGTRLADTERRAQKVESVLSRFPEIDAVTVQVGTDDLRAGSGEGENVATLTVRLKNPEETARIQDQLIEKMRRAVLEVTSEQVTFTLPTLFSFKTAIELQIFGDDLGVLRDLGREAMLSIEDVRGLKDMDFSLKRGYPEIHIVLDRELLATKNLEPYQVAQLLRTEIQGDVATHFSRAGEKIDIRVRADRERLTSVEDLRNLSILDGVPPTPLSSVARIEIEEGPSEIRRIDQRQVAIVTANVEGRDLGSVAADIEARMERLNWPDGYSYALGGQNRELQTSYGGLLFALALAVFLVYVVMACQFESIWHPALIMFSVPLALIGVIYVLNWVGMSLSIVVFIGVIVLAGIVVNSAIILVDYINQLRERGMRKVDAIVQAGTVRFRPIMMTTMTTVLGLIPMVISGGEGAEIRRPMALTVMAGLISATVLTLFIIPIVYNSFGGRERG
ncbi:MAG: efflux RND transporter permease subunit [Candidatus Hydrogenedentes bacterium]|nr:efflux RND transporter permease subunit [Candidatus Hydrogenedentota bacterium]